MRRVKITLPATIAGFGPGLSTPGLALGLHTTIEIYERSDETLIVETEGEGAGSYGLGLQHPVSLAMMRVFQQRERTIPGITIKVDNEIPLRSGLGAEAAFTVAGVVAAANLLGTTFSRMELLSIAAQINQQPVRTASAILGGLNAGVLHDDKLLYRTLPLTPFRLVVAVPQIDDYHERISSATQELVRFADAADNLKRLPLLLDALRTGDLELAGQMLTDKLRIASLSPHIPGYHHVVEMAHRAGAIAVTLSGDGPAIIALATNSHSKIMEAIQFAFEQSSVETRAWVLAVDTQGIVVSIAQSA